MHRAKPTTDRCLYVPNAPTDAFAQCSPGGRRARADRRQSFIASSAASCGFAFLAPVAPALGARRRAQAADEPRPTGRRGAGAASSIAAPPVASAPWSGQTPGARAPSACVGAPPSSSLAPQPAALRPDPRQRARATSSWPYNGRRRGRMTGDFAHNGRARATHAPRCWRYPPGSAACPFDRVACALRETAWASVRGSLLEYPTALSLRSADGQVPAPRRGRVCALYADAVARHRGPAEPAPRLRQSTIWRAGISNDRQPRVAVAAEGVRGSRAPIVADEPMSAGRRTPSVSPRPPRLPCSRRSPGRSAAAWPRKVASQANELRRCVG